MKPGIVIVTHYRLGEEFLQALRLIVPDAPEFHSVSVEPTQSVEEMRTKSGYFAGQTWRTAPTASQRNRIRLASGPP